MNKQQGGFQTAALKAAEPTTTTDSKYINIGDATELQLVLLPDLNDTNPAFFSQEVLMHRATINGDRSSISCMKQYKDDNDKVMECPACKLSQAYYQQGEKGKGSKLYRKVEHILNVKVLSDILPEGSTAESQAGKIGQIRLTYQTWNALIAGLSDTDLSDVDFTNLKEALPFIVRKTTQGDFPNYSTSAFGRKPVKMSDKDIKECMEAIEDLSTFVPDMPEVEIMEGWTAAAQGSLDGTATATGTMPSGNEYSNSGVAETTLEEIRQRRNARNS